MEWLVLLSVWGWVGRGGEYLIRRDEEDNEVVHDLGLFQRGAQGEVSED